MRKEAVIPHMRMIPVSRPLNCPLINWSSERCTPAVFHTRKTVIRTKRTINRNSPFNGVQKADEDACHHGFIKRG